MNKFLFGSATALCTSFFYFNHFNTSFEIDFKDTTTNRDIINSIHHFRNGVYNSTFYLPLRFMQIIYSHAIDRRAYLRYDREIVMTPDGENLAVDWATIHARFEDSDAQEEMPVVILLPGITGSSNSNYIKEAGDRLRKAGFRPVVFNFRGRAIAQISENLFDYRYMKEDLDVVVKHVQKKYPKANLYFNGFSLGASIGVGYMAINPGKVKAMACVANPFDVYKAGESANRLANRIYS